MELDKRCEALIVTHPEATDKERRCENLQGEWIYDGYYGPSHLCDRHAKSYCETGYELRKK